MKTDKIFELIDENNNKKEYRILADFNINDNFYLIYTDDSINSNGEIETYANEYEVTKGKILLKEIKKEMLPNVYKKWDELWQEV